MLRKRAKLPKKLVLFKEPEHVFDLIPCSLVLKSELQFWGFCGKLGEFLRLGENKLVGKELREPILNDFLKKTTGIDYQKQTQPSRMGWSCPCWKARSG